MVLQVVAALGLLNVWITRSSKPTPYRGAGAESMSAEFAAYGLPGWFMWVVGAIKVGVAVALLRGLWIPELVRPSSLTPGGDDARRLAHAPPESKIRP